MIILMIIIGGITRLTDSGLSMTEWNLISGIVPPLNTNDWIILFENIKTLQNTILKTLILN